jgi:membrane-bound ClpP family serine protease
MNIISRTITGTIMVLFGIFLLALPIFTEMPWFASGIYGIIILILGIVILINKKEDIIEQIKHKRRK